MKKSNADRRSPSLELTHNHYNVGWVCALPKEQTAATAMLDRIHPDLPKPSGDHNTYTLGSIGSHNIVITCLPKGKYGNNSASSAATRMISTFPSIKFGLMVGVGGGIPTKVRLGDVVISAPIDEFPGVVQWDMGKAQAGGSFKRTGALNNPPNALLTALTKLETKHEMHGSQIRQYLDDFGKTYPNLMSKYTWSDSLKDPLSTQESPYRPLRWQAIFSLLWKITGDILRYLLGWWAFAAALAAEPMISTVNIELDNFQRKPGDVRVHYGLIASGNQVIKDAKFRDRLDQSLGGNVLCVEMEAAGLMNDFPCITIRGICDYANSQKTKDWQEYAAAVAAACAKELLEHVQASDVDGERPVKDILGDVIETVQRAEVNIEAMRSRWDRKSDVEVLDWLTAIDYGPQHSDVLRRWQQGTGQWFLNSKEYQNWRSSSKQTLFCPGIPGAGKTILVSTVIDDLSTEFLNDQTIGIAYLYCKLSRRSEQKIEDLLASLVKQLSQDWPSLPDSIGSLHTKHKRKKTRPSLEEIWKTLLSVASMYSRVFIIVDALDECQASNKDECLSTFLSKMFTLQSQTMTSLFATSRPIPVIEGKFEGCISKRISASEGDIRKYLDSNMTKLPGFVLESPRLQDEIKTEIIRAVDGMFLLARLHLHSLVGKKSPKAVHDSLEKLPRGSDAYDRTYDKAMKRIKKQAEAWRELAGQDLSWITCARRQLSVLELQHALTVEANKSEFDRQNMPRVADILSACAGLVTIDEESDIIRLYHYTTQEYFDRRRNRWFPEAEAEITQTCVSYLLLRSFESGPCQTRDEFDRRLWLNKLYHYSASHWGHHAREASTLCAEVMGFLECEAKVEAASQALIGGNNMRYSGKTQTSGLHLAAYFGLEECVIRLLTNGMPCDMKDSDGQTALHWAAKNGQAGTAELLLKKGLDANWANKEGKTALHYAAIQGDSRLIQVLVDYKADMEHADIHGQTPLLAAVRETNFQSVQQLIGLGASIEAVDYMHRSALHLSAITGRCSIHITSLLLSRGACHEICDVENMTPFYYAIRNGSEEMAEMFIRAGVCVNTGIARRRWVRTKEAGQWGYEPLPEDRKSKKVGDGLTPLHWAALIGHPAMVEYLLSKGADPNKRCQDGETPLHLAIRGDITLDYGDSWNQISWRIEILSDLVDPASEEADETRRSISEVRTAVIDNLLSHINIDVDVQNDQMQAALHLAICGESNSLRSFSRLMSKKPDISIRNNKGQTPLHLASGAGEAKIVQELLAAGASVDVLDSEGLSPLQYAVRSEKSSVVVLELILKYHNLIGSNPCLQTDSTGKNLLHYHVQTEVCSEEIIRILLEHGVDINGIDEDGNSPLSLFLRTSHLIKPAAICPFLLTRGACPLWSDHVGRNLAHISMLSSSFISPDQVLSTLKDFAVDITTKDLNNRGILHYGARHGSIRQPIIDLLRESDSLGLHDHDEYGRTPISYAKEQAMLPRDPDSSAQGRWASTLNILMKADEDWAASQSS
ncbi:unnamed protein product [Penicillium egyptiacum]|uniref:Nucleoside phosphorylase domain-containing protein n=1 Tax=Penicillium egyptiacum TaxID=1303716 RepID=A0A9W4P9D7_9EURO|nr:unnamed protein product [Penicillium egyptiacum]